MHVKLQKGTGYRLLTLKLPIIIKLFAVWDNSYIIQCPLPKSHHAFIKYFCYVKVGKSRDKEISYVI